MTHKFLSVAYNTDFDNYITNIVDKYHEHIAEVYFPLPADVLPNARGSLKLMDSEHIIKLCKYLVGKNIRPVGLFNSSWTPVEVYANEYMNYVVDRIEPLVDAGMTKLIVNNYYIISAKIFDKAIAGLEVTASINSRHDTPDKVMAHVAFNKPKHVYLDRSFNRKWNEFVNVAQSLKTLNIETSVLVNEGCLYNCPFKTDHDVQISMGSYAGDDFLHYTSRVLTKYSNINETISCLNTSSGCGNVYSHNPWYLLKSPFIRPEDLTRYLPYVTYAKIAGRNRSTEWLENVVKAYISGEYKGSIVDLLDVADSHVLEAKLYPNDKLGGLLDLNGNCHKVCISCGRCKKFFDERCIGVNSEQVTCDEIDQLDGVIKNAVDTINKGDE